MLIHISKNFCHIEFEAAEEPTAEYLQNLYDLLPGPTQNQSGTEKNVDKKPDAPAAKTAPKLNTAEPATERQILKLQQFGYTDCSTMTKKQAHELLNKLLK